MSLSPEAEAIVADRVRIWEVRRFCQIANISSNRIACGNVDQQEPETTTRPAQTSDPALSALVRCLLYELDADIAAVSLLDDRSQYFLSVVQRSNLHDPAITTDSLQWYSCASVSHRGGLCARTLTIDDIPGEDNVFEIEDLRAREDTRNSPAVNGTLARFQHYAGVPLTIAAGHKIGTLFFFKNDAAPERLTPAQRHYLCETARHVVGQITQTLEALEAKNVLRCNSVVSSLANVQEPGHQSSPPAVNATAETSIQPATSASDIYHDAIMLLSQTFDLEKIIIQEVPHPNAVGTSSHANRDKLLASHCSNGTPTVPIADFVANKLLKAFPSGVILHTLKREENGGVYLASASVASDLRNKIRLDLREMLPSAEQVVFMPLWDTFHDRNVAFILGGTAESTRVLSSTADLQSLGSFGATIMTQVRRFGALNLERRKADFLGSISHEMRSPLHGILACVDLLLGADCSPEQLDLLQSAESCGLQLRDNIDNLLQFSNIGSPSPNLAQNRSFRLDRVGSRPADPRQNTGDESEKETLYILDSIEETIEKDNRKFKGFTPATPAAERSSGWGAIADSKMEMEGGLAQPACNTTIVVDVDPSAYFPLQPHCGIDVVIDSLLGNAVKFTDSAGCVRVSIESDSTNTRLLFKDSGRGISNDFVQHNLYVPFAQQDPLDSGTGLGLSLAHSVVKKLGGEIVVTTDETQGTEVLVTLPRDRVADSDDGLRGNLRHEALTSTDDHSPLTVGLFSPTQWKDADSPRQQRCTDSFRDSLTRTLKSWCNFDSIASILSSHETQPIMPDIVLLLHTDLEHFRSKTGDAFQKIQKIILCPDPQALAKVQASRPGDYAAILGPVCPWKVRTAIASCRLGLRRLSGSSQADASAPENDSNVQTEQAEAGMETPDPTPFNEDTRHLRNGDAPISPPATPFLSGALKQLDLDDEKALKEPRFLLVDDNIINLKVVGAYAKKCTKLPTVSAGGGRQALDAFKNARFGTDGKGLFDIILLDLSMPEISGFEVAATIREMERSEPERPRVYIAALTGLVSDKDREAAFTAGVDEYVTKPSALKALQNVVTNWRNAVSAQQQDG